MITLYRQGLSWVTLEGIFAGFILFFLIPEEELKTQVSKDLFSSPEAE